MLDSAIRVDQQFIPGFPGELGEERVLRESASRGEPRLREFAEDAGWNQGEALRDSEDLADVPSVR
jgi:hypothetical protein